ncbi:MAG: thiosulfate oxidation carrier complex protein SoxZ [Pseudomonadales bacterium]|nr:thiosulfate oxidation carrier complex protein SoxZ [Pseudomonadales bacterium]
MTIRIAIPSQAKVGEIIEIRTLIQHPMETGFRRDEYGRAIPRDILERFSCLYNGEIVFEATLFPAVTANPYLTFCTRATESGTLVFRWTDQRGEVFEETADLEVV